MNWSERRDLNSGPPVPQTGALTGLRYAPFRPCASSPDAGQLQASGRRRIGRPPVTGSGHTVVDRSFSNRTRHAAARRAPAAAFRLTADSSTNGGSASVVASTPRAAPVARVATARSATASALRLPCTGLRRRRPLRRRRRLHVLQPVFAMSFCTPLMVYPSS